MAEQLPNMENVETAQVVEKKSNPLQGFYRQPKIYIKLPSGGDFYDAGSLDHSENGEYPVFAMTAKDELMLKTPDALLSGQSTVEVIKSCVPAILNPWKMPTIDVDAVLIAIRIATYGEKMAVTSKCPKCNEENDYDIPLTKYLNAAQSLEYIKEIPVGELLIHLRPYTYKMLTETNIKAMEQQRIFNIVNDETLSDQQKIDKFSESFVKLTALTVDTVAGCIEKIDTPNGSSTDKEQIKEFINNSSKDVFDKISDVLTKMQQQTTVEDQQVKCNECEHEYSMPVTLDQANFFVDRS